MTEPHLRDLSVAVILNGISSHKKKFYTEILPALSPLCKAEVFETKSKDHAVDLSRRASETNYDVVLAAGGDGTIHQVVNGIVSAHTDGEIIPVVGVIPLGSGNDFARALGLLESPTHKLILLLKKFSPKLIDVGKLICSGDDNKDRCSYFINEVSIGIGPDVVKRVANSNRLPGPALTYYKNILLTFLRYKPKYVEAVAPNWKWQGKMRSIALANGKYYGHGLCIAPESNPSDQMLNAFICGNVSVFDFIRYTGTLKRGEIVKHPEVHYKLTDRIELTSNEECPIEADGELLGRLPASIELSNLKIRFLF
jgi:diacylglycerol kinase (ATP)